MKFRKHLNWLAVLALSATSLGQEQGYWHAASDTAKSATGDIGFAGEKIVINYYWSTAVADIRPLKPAEVAAVFDVPADSAGTGTLYRLNIPASRTFIRKRALCGADDTQWAAVYVTGRSMQLAFFSGSKMPEFTMEAISGAQNLCGTYTYSR